MSPLNWFGLDTLFWEVKTESAHKNSKAHPHPHTPILFFESPKDSLSLTVEPTIVCSESDKKQIKVIFLKFVLAKFPPKEGESMR